MMGNSPHARSILAKCLPHYYDSSCLAYVPQPVVEMLFCAERKKLVDSKKDFLAHPSKPIIDNTTCESEGAIYREPIPKAANI